MLWRAEFYSYLGCYYCVSGVGFAIGALVEIQVLIVAEVLRFFDDDITSVSQSAPL